jgi:hypothetical protein
LSTDAMTDFRVISTGLNLRSAGIVAPGNIVAVLPQNQIVTRTGSEPDTEKWWRVRTTFMGNILEGFVSKAFLSGTELTEKAKEKVLWVVNYANLDWFVDRATFVKATAVAIRTDNDLETAIPIFHAKGIKVYGWRWPSAQKERALQEADRVIKLLGKGLDGYYVDPEGEPGQHYDWNQTGLEPLAEEFCKKITAAFPGKPFGTTSHFRAVKIFAKLPWKPFIKYSNVLLPQSYWQVEGGTVNGGDPKKNYRTSITDWETSGGSRTLIVPMAGELAHITAAEIKSYAEEATAQGISSLHFYTATPAVKSDVWKAIANLELT